MMSILHATMIRYWKKLAKTTERRPMSASRALSAPRIKATIQISILSGNDELDGEETICMQAIAVENRTSEANIN